MNVATIECQLIQLIKSKLDKKILSETIFILNEEKFNERIKRVKEKLISKKYINRLQKVVTKYFNILIIGKTNVGKSTLIKRIFKFKRKRESKRRFRRTY